MLFICIAAVLCAYGAVMAVWTLLGRWLGVPLTAGTADWIRTVYQRECRAPCEARGRD
ncbi:MAG: hypothetical protein LBH95_07085 [Oscillospiraceae bacterium]|nr:hypothetical protein [Oscillospiraceae bacterium]